MELKKPGFEPVTRPGRDRSPCRERFMVLITGFRTSDLSLTKEVLYRLSYMSKIPNL